ncbi:hypothetical protein PFLUV_G00169400 [Perca fluviatilis]|uniref:Uncharacterized protein n=2 Tax=Perca fluviatilis TaxID=8168 RepID=A0A6A5F1P5_PERFL|nr:hypothetical protein PFLUV_G00169400 [Perca fluviatilis]
MKVLVCVLLAVLLTETSASSSGLVPNVSLYDVVWSYSDPLAEEILRSSSFVEALRSSRLTERCYTRFVQQEALYLHRVSSILGVLVNSLQEEDDIRSLLLDTLKHYSSRNQSVQASPPPQWLLSSLLSFPSLVLEEPVYWLVALSARAGLRRFLAERLLFSQLRPGASLLFEAEEWSKETLREVAWTRRYRRVLEERQDRMDVFKAINIFREHMLNQKSFYKTV